MALKLRRRAEMITNAILPPTTGAGTFKRVLGAANTLAIRIATRTDHDHTRR